MKKSTTINYSAIEATLLFTFILFSSLVSAQELSSDNPEKVNVSEVRLQRISDYLENAVATELVPGGVFLVARKGNIVYHESFGKRDSLNPYSTEDIFRIGSMTKAVTCVAILQLYERGLLGLDDPVSLFLPEFKEMSVIASVKQKDTTWTSSPASKQITIRHLMTHTSGIGYGLTPESLVPVYAKLNISKVAVYNKINRKDLIKKVANAPLAFEPGHAHLYGLNMDVLGWVVEKLSGLSLKEYFQKNIFEPIGMDDTYFYLPKDKYRRLVPVLTKKDGEYVVVEEMPTTIDNINYPKAEDQGFYAGGGGLSSTALDYAKFIQMLLNKGVFGGVRILNTQTIKMINTDQRLVLNLKENAFSKKSGVTFGLGFRLYTDKAAGLTIKSPGTYEWGGAFNTQYFIDPAEQLIFVGMTQSLPYKDGYFWDRLYPIIYGALED